MSAGPHEDHQLHRELKQLRQRVRELEQQLAERGRHSAGDVATSGATRPRPDSEVAVLIVDDDDAKRYIWARALSSAGLRVMEAASGHEALLSLGREPADLVLLDVNLPDTTGFDLCDRIKSTAATAGTPVVLVSAVFVSGRDHVRGLEGGAEAYLSGEVDPDVVVATVRALTRMHRAEAALKESEARFRAMFSLAAVGMGQTDASGRLVAVNPKLCEMLGYTESELIGRVFTEITSGRRRGKPPAHAGPLGRGHR